MVIIVILAGTVIIGANWQVRPDMRAGPVILLSRQVKKSWFSGFMFGLGISKMPAGPVDLHIFAVSEEMRVLGFLSVGGLLILDFRFNVPSILWPCQRIRDSKTEHKI